MYIAKRREDGREGGGKDEVKRNKFYNWTKSVPNSWQIAVFTHTASFLLIQRCRAVTIFNASLLVVACGMIF